jgi:hypothetical protein
VYHRLVVCTVVALSLDGGSYELDDPAIRSG